MLGKFQGAGVGMSEAIRPSFTEPKKLLKRIQTYLPKEITLSLSLSLSLCPNIIENELDGTESWPTKITSIRVTRINY